MHLVGRFVSCQLYRRERASLKAPLWSAKPCSSMGRAVSQEEAPFSLARVTTGCSFFTLNAQQLC